MIVDRQSKQVIGSGSLIIEKKFIRQLGTAGHIEDIVVQAEHRGKHLGLKLIELLKALAEINQCYKVILDCNQNVVGFYEKVSYNLLTIISVVAELIRGQRRPDGILHVSTTMKVAGILFPN